MSGRSPHFRLTAASSVPSARALFGSPLSDATNQDSIVCFYHRERDTGWLEPFVASLRVVGFAGPIHCIGAFDDRESPILSHHRCTAHGLFETDFSIGADNLAHFCFCQLLDELAMTGDGHDGQIMLFESVHAVFQRDPFIGKTIGLSVFCEGSTRIGESEFNLHRVAHFGETDDALRRRPIISSAVLRGELGVLRDFYRRILTEYRWPGRIAAVRQKYTGCRELGLPWRSPDLPGRRASQRGRHLLSDIGIRPCGQHGARHNCWRCCPRRNLQPVPRHRAVADIATPARDQRGTTMTSRRSAAKRR